VKSGILANNGVHDPDREIPDPPPGALAYQEENLPPDD
jgi:hypothetical protein